MTGAVGPQNSFFPCAPARPRAHISLDVARPDQCPLCTALRTQPGYFTKSEKCRFCCRSPLLAFAKGDSVALTRFAAEASDDGAAEARAGAAFLRVSARRGEYRAITLCARSPPCSI